MIGIDKKCTWINLHFIFLSTDVIFATFPVYHRSLNFACSKQNPTFKVAAKNTGN